MADLLRLDQVSKAFGALLVTRDVSLTVQAGDAVGIIGPNGAGKTTLFSLVAGTQRTSAGRIWFDGKDVTRWSAARRCKAGIARSFQVPQPFIGLSTFENVLVAALFGGARAFREAERRALEVLQRTGLAAKATVQAARLTLLDRKRLELARALATEPHLLLLDEIAGGLTEAECGELVDLVRTINRAGVTIIWIEHVVHALLAVVGRLIVLDTGALLADGAPRETLANPDVLRLYVGLPHD